MNHKTDIPAGLFGEALLRDWCGPLLVVNLEGQLVRALAVDLEGGSVVVGYTENNHWNAFMLDPDPSATWFPLSRKECRHRLCVVLNGEKWNKRDKMFGEVISEAEALRAIEENRIPDQVYKRKPAPAWHILPKEEGGKLPSEYAHHAPVLLTRHARRVAIEKNGIIGLLGPWIPIDNGAIARPPIVLQRRREQDLEESRVIVYAWNTWRVGNNHTDSADALEECKVAADAIALEAGYALLDENDLLSLPPMESINRKGQHDK